jgi:hypothetical protein
VNVVELLGAVRQLLASRHEKPAGATLRPEARPS